VGGRGRRLRLEGAASCPGERQILGLGAPAGPAGDPDGGAGHPDPGLPTSALPSSSGPAPAARACRPGGLLLVWPRALLCELEPGGRAGETVLIGGPSGAGKSTLLLLLAGVISPASGTVDIEVSAWDKGRAPPLEWLCNRPTTSSSNPRSWKTSRSGPRRSAACRRPRRRRGRAAPWQEAAPGRGAPRTAAAGSAEPRPEAAGRRGAGVWALARPSGCSTSRPPGLDASGIAALRAAVRRFTARGGAVVLVHQDPRLDVWPGRRLGLSEGRLEPLA